MAEYGGPSQVKSSHVTSRQVKSRQVTAPQSWHATPKKKRFALIKYRSPFPTHTLTRRFHIKLLHNLAILLHLNRTTLQETNMEMSSYCGFGGAEQGKPFQMLPQSGVPVGQFITLSTLPTLRQMQPGFVGFPQCGCSASGPRVQGAGYHAGYQGGAHQGGAHHGAAHQGGGGGKVSLGSCGTCGNATAGSSCGGAVEAARSPMAAAGGVAQKLSDMPHAAAPHAPAQGSGPSGPSAGSDAGSHGLVSVVAYGQPWCSWSNRFATGAKQINHARVHYTTQLPSNAPAATAFPTVYAVKNGTYKVLQQGYVDVTDPQKLKALLVAAEKKFA